MLKNICILLILFFFTGQLVLAESPSIDLKIASRYFQETEELCKKNKTLWNVPLYGPILFVDPESRMIVANQADKKGLLKAKDGVFLGVLPKEVTIANTAVDWAGNKWSMVKWPLPEERQPREQLITHELFHRIQSELGLITKEAQNKHLESKIGRIWLRLEWQALEKALYQEGIEQQKAIKDAIYFREYRRSLFNNSWIEENYLEINEGLAEYTGIKLSSKSPKEFAFIAGYNLKQAHRKPSYTRSFAYASGPAYGCLLDRIIPSWKKSINKDSDLAKLLQTTLKINFASLSEKEAILRATNYDGEELIALETKRDLLYQERATKYLSQLVEKEIFIIPLGDKVSYSFNPNNLLVLENIGTVYPTMEVIDEWGILEVFDGALVFQENGKLTKLHITKPVDPVSKTLQGNGWKLDLKAGWKIVPAERNGDFKLEKEEPKI
ncbi:MAG: hypothetical protein JNM06_17420 [Blastocatellia bacterium]|nr:hypothetical protein [Blastocatellia bacterium]MBN8724085.1 hypothetical protein [Acidobacteriota bacterium]